MLRVSNKIAGRETDKADKNKDIDIHMILFFIFLAGMGYLFWRMYRKRIYREKLQSGLYDNNKQQATIYHPPLRTQLPEKLKKDIQDILKAYDEKKLLQKAAAE